MTVIKQYLLILFLAAGILPLSGETVKLKDYTSQGPLLDTLKIELFCVPDDKSSFWTEMSLWADDFYSSGSEKTVKILKDKTKLTYKVWMRPEPAPLVAILPGIGGHYTGNASTAMAYLLYKNGYSPLIISSAFNYEFMESAGKHTVPGYTPRDALDVYNALKKVIEDLKSRYGKEKFLYSSLVGLSLGGLHTLYISDFEQKVREPIFEKYLAINPPVNMLYAIEEIDKLMNTWKLWSKRELDSTINNSGLLYMGLMGHDIPASKPLPATNKEAEFLIGANFMMILRNTIFTVHREKDFGFIRSDYSWFSREEIYAEIDRFSFMDYFNTFIKKYYGKQLEGMTAEDVAEKSGLRAIEDSLAKNQKVRVIHNQNDFLVKASDIEWLQKTLDKRITVFDKGGHLGNLYTEQVSKEIIKLLKSPRKMEYAVELPLKK